MNEKGEEKHRKHVHTGNKQLAAEMKEKKKQPPS